MVWGDLAPRGLAAAVHAVKSSHNSTNCEVQTLPSHRGGNIASGFFVVAEQPCFPVHHMHSILQGSIQTRVDEQLSTSQTVRQGEDTVDENAPPEMPDPQVSVMCRYW